MLLLLLVSLASAAWLEGPRASPHDMHSVAFFVRYTAGSLQSCDSLLKDISDPKSKRWGYEYSAEEAGALFRDERHEKALLKHLRVSGLTGSQIKVSPQGEFVRITGTVAQLEKATDARFHYHMLGNQRVIRDIHYTMPARLRKHVSHVINVKELPQLKRALRRDESSVTLKRQTNVATPQLLAKYYNIQNNNVSTGLSNIAVFEAGGPGGLNFNPDDLTAYQQKWNLPQVPINNFVGPNDPSVCANDPTCQSSFNACGEPSLDVEQIFAVAQNVNMTYWSIQAANQGMFLNYAEAVAAESNPPKVHSISYGFVTELDPIQDVEQFETFSCKLALRRITMLVSAGDDGVNSRQACGQQQCDPTYQATYPAVSAYVVAVGATQGPESGSTEIVCSSTTGGLITSGGGFSNVIARPSYQEDAVNYYLQNGVNVPASNMFNSSGRAYPDITGLGHNFPVLITGSTCVGSGTSQSCPLIAAMVALVNGMRISNGQSAIGWLNPHLYSVAVSTPSAFHDITTGSNGCCAGQGSQPFCCGSGFTAGPGFDVPSGLGSPNFEVLAQALSSL